MVVGLGAIVRPAYQAESAAPRTCPSQKNLPTLYRAKPFPVRHLSGRKSKIWILNRKREAFTNHLKVGRTVWRPIDIPKTGKIMQTKQRQRKRREARMRATAWSPIDTQVMITGVQTRQRQRIKQQKDPVTSMMTPLMPIKSQRTKLPHKPIKPGPLRLSRVIWVQARLRSRCHRNLACRMENQNPGKKHSNGMSPSMLLFVV
mmetsp:Transcript_35968/g.56130  ORF Transcript_35968/g.56130 Transcript_35968/m.56130 type:complete len:203 (-) Transcript_35968:871-1479(-)